VSDASAPRRLRAAAFFDLDRTLIAGSSAYTLAVAAWRAGIIPAKTLLRDGLGAVTFRLTGASDAKAQQARQRVLEVVTGTHHERLVSLNADVVPKLIDQVRPEARRLLEMHARAGRNTYVVSAAPQELVGPLATALGMAGGIGTVAEVDADGVYTGALTGPFVYAKGKVAAIRAIAAREGYDLALSYAYSDSMSDLPMLESVGHPVAVNPDNALADAAHDRGWPIVIFSRKTRRIVRRSSEAAAAGALAAGAFISGVAVGKRGGLRALVHR
jgi:HAD superfamily hydrolase (TIGR01490 family)